jgi:inosine-uridine nucleoside N-ribohydrolase
MALLPVDTPPALCCSRKAIDAAEEREPLTVIALAPLTNIAVAIRMQPELCRRAIKVRSQGDSCHGVTVTGWRPRVRRAASAVMMMTATDGATVTAQRIVWMGGSAFAGGNASPWAEANAE